MFFFSRQSLLKIAKDEKKKKKTVGEQMSSSCLTCIRARMRVGGKQTWGMWKMFWRAPYSTSVTLRLLELLMSSSSEILSRAWGMSCGMVGVRLHCE